METILIRALQLILSLSILVIVHECGHFLFARLYKIRVEKFYLFFDPWFALFRFKPKGSDTEYGVGWLPLGGYVKIAGMVDESMDIEQMSKPAQPWEFRSKPAWQRLMVMVGGVLFNFILAIFIYSMMLFTWGYAYQPLHDTPYGMEFSQAAKNAGFQDGDILWSADGKVLDNIDYDLRKVIYGNQVEVMRNGVLTTIQIPNDMMTQILDEDGWFTRFRFPFVLDSVLIDSPAKKAGLQRGDSIVTLNNQPVSFSEFRTQLAEMKKTVVATGHLDSITPLRIGFYRSGIAHQLVVPVDTAFRIGAELLSTTSRLLPTTRLHYGFFSSFPAGIEKGVHTISGYVSDMRVLGSKEGLQHIGGFGTLGKLFPANWNWVRFWEMTAFLSIILAVMNILPIPALDGGHILFLLYEIIARRKPSLKFLERAQMVGMILLFGLLILANFNDILRAFSII